MNELEFFSHLKKYLSSNEIDLLKEELNKEQKYSSILIDEDKINPNEILKLYPSLIPHPIVKNVFLFDKKELDLGKSLLFEIGAFYIFEPCSSLVNYFLNPNENDIILDMASAPGGKTIHASFLMHNKGQIIANEISSSRAEILSQNIEKYGRKNVTVISSEVSKLVPQFQNFFTKIILDAPCSGSGMFRKENKMKEDWTYQKVLYCSKIQKELILQAYSMLKEGGELIYSTCSFSYEEDEEVISYLLENTDAELINLPSITGEYRSSLNQTIHLLPFLFNGEGHFIAKIKKPGILTKPNLPKYKNPLSLPLDGQTFINNKNEIYLTNYVLTIKNIRILRNGINKNIDAIKNLINKLDDLADKTIIYYYNLLDDLEQEIEIDKGHPYKRLPKNFETLLENNEFKFMVYGLDLTIDDIKNHLDYDETFWNYIKDKIKVFKNPYLDYESKMDYYGVWYDLDENKELTKLIICIPKIVDLKTAQIALHELKHAHNIYMGILKEDSVLEKKC